MKQKPGSLRDSLPEIAQWIDDLRAAFGREPVDEAIRRGMRGENGFCVRRNGQVVVGTPLTYGPGVPVSDERKVRRDER